MAHDRFPGPPEFPQPPGYPRPGEPGPGEVPPSRVWADPGREWQDKIAERLLAKRIVLASGVLDDDAAARLSAQLLTLDADADDPIVLQLQNLRGELTAALSVMGILDTVASPVHAHAGGETHGPALGVLASCPRRLAYPNATFTLTEPREHFGGTVTAVTEREQHVARMTDSLFYRLAEATGRDADEIRDDARHTRTLTTAEALGYGLITERLTKPELPVTPACHMVAAMVIAPLLPPRDFCAGLRYNAGDSGTYRGDPGGHFAWLSVFP